MNPTKRRIYWDACVFLSAFDGNPQRKEVMRSMLEQNMAVDGEISIMTSTYTIAEVAFAAQEREAKLLDEAILKSIDAFWEGSGILLLEFHQLLAYDARELGRKFAAGGRSLRGKDSVHMATAARHSAVELHTYDEKLLRIGEFDGIKICKPSLQQPLFEFSAK